MLFPRLPCPHSEPYPIRPVDCMLPKRSSAHGEFSGIILQGLGILILLLTIAQPQAMNIVPTGCHSSICPSSHVPPSTPSPPPPPTFPSATHAAIAATIAKLVGIGVPSKYLLFPVESFGNEETVTLNRASRVSPQSTKNERVRVSRALRRPRAKAHAAGATPKDIYS